MSCPEQSHGHGVSCQGLETAERLLGKHRCDFWLCVWFWCGLGFFWPWI